ncbi:DUF397 domain-containing protein [Streptomyces iconiensis]|uniref:DUF397 domain-containing protein n=1 Tax=Streptomyces iconiensis TaxID=1384038 RepID=A0ABT7A1G1_9ACTN|nr:DUF397 domain-containing protein [Streptomyces iconiensis]MDJ1134681.1 DUF397 domain-containing protein [Streptomyces iconiensis]
MSIKRDVRELEGLSWFKSSYSGSDGGNCVEVAGAGQLACVRDTKNQNGPTLSIPGDQWSAFVAHVAERNR